MQTSFDDEILEVLLVDWKEFLHDGQDMTLLITFLTHSHVVQVSDRRVTYRNRRDGSIDHFDDQRNKSILYCSRFAIAYTGAARIRNSDADRWLAELLGQYDGISDAFNDMPRALGDLWSSNGFLGLRLAVQAAGWRRDPQGLHPFAVTVSNFNLRSGDLLTTDGGRFGTTYYDLVGSVAFSFTALGVGLPADAQRELKRNMRRAGEHQTTINPYVELMVRAVRKVARRPTEDSVGEDVLATVLPRAGVRPDEESRIILAGPPLDSMPTFRFYPSDSDEPTIYGPHFVCGGTVMTDFEAYPL